MGSKSSKLSTSRTEGILKRLSLIIQKVKYNEGISSKELGDYLNEQLKMYDYLDVGTSKKTIERDTAIISRLFGIDIKHSKKRGWYIENDSWINVDYERLLEHFDLLEILTLDSKLRKYVFPEKKKRKGSEYISWIIEAIKESVRIEFKYRKFDNTITKERRTVEPYALKEFKGRWYLLAMEIDGRPEEKGEIKTWGLDRIQELSISEKKFKRNIQLNLEDEFKDVFGIHSDKEKPIEEVILSFTPTSGRYNESLPLHKSQVTLVDNDKEFKIKLNVKLTNDFIMELLSQSENMTVISPQHLKEVLINIHQSAIKQLQTVD